MDIDPNTAAAAVASIAAGVRLLISAWDKYDARRHERAMARLEMELRACVQRIEDSEPPPPS